MRKFSTVFSFWVVLGWASIAGAVEPYFELGLGLPEIGRVQGGIYLIDDLSIDVVASSLVFNIVTGVGATGYLFRTFPRPETHSMALRGAVVFNPFIDPIRIKSGGETIGSAVMTHIGYAYDAGTGFLVRALFEGFHLIDGGGYVFNFGVSVGVGWRFGPRRW